MAENSAIEWTTHTFNPWWGCTKVGPGCDHCYAESFDKRVGGSHWGAGAPRRLVNDWSKPRKWDREAQKSGIRPWVFCASMADVFDNEVPPEWRARMWGLVRECRNLRWQFVTKRIGNAAKMLPADWSDAFGHCGLISTIVTQAEADRDIPKLLGTPAAWRGLSMEPLVEAVDISAYVGKLDWVIVGAESGPNARPMAEEWAINIVGQGRAAGTACFVKQLSGPRGRAVKDIAAFPALLQVREMPPSLALPASAIEGGTEP
ncbi:DUF5131 family protein [Methylobacterium sp. WL19]|uniref:DUF5131 family protein n=1 Tax=Methylobacterium sp. WL19 TaxID=2603896 RepID=UPI0011C850AF|nr:DUF5131 family protein [Methylobacterium sp. WL19]TXN22071.1 DUF5131 family protein [Methylobacterium sp. WL19]